MFTFMNLHACKILFLFNILFPYTLNIFFTFHLFSASYIKSILFFLIVYYVFCNKILFCYFILLYCCIFSCILFIAFYYFSYIFYRTNMKFHVFLYICIINVILSLKLVNGQKDMEVDYVDDPEDSLHDRFATELSLIQMDLEDFCEDLATIFKKVYVQNSSRKQLVSKN